MPHSTVIGCIRKKY